MKTQCLLWISVLILTNTLFAQNPPPYPQGNAILDTNDMIVNINVGGDISWDLIGNPGFEVPKGSGNHALFAANLWVGAIDEGGQLRMSASTYRQSGFDMWPGPVATGGNYDSAYDARYGQIWKVDADEILTHQMNAGQPGYTPPASIMTWPGNGDTTNGEAWQLAPFVDLNSNGIYEPAAGEYPDVPGDQALYHIFSDVQYPNTESQGAPTGLEIHQLAYMYDTTAASIIDRTVFFSYKLINRSSGALNDLHVGHWADFDLGSGFDDYIGCDTTLDMFYVYNADSVDTFYPSPPPALGVIYLNRPLSYFRTYLNDFSNFGNPTAPTDYYAYLQNYWLDGSQMTVGGNGTQGTVPTNYIYPGNPNEPSEWSEVSVGNPIGDRRAIGSSGPYTLLPDERLCFDYAITFAQADTGNHLTSVAELYDRVSEVKDFYLASSHGCQRLGLVSVDPDLAEPPFSIYPNPVSDQLFIQLNGTRAQVRLLDARGRMLQAVQGAGDTLLELDVQEYAAGFYVVEILAGSNRSTWKLIKK